MKTPLWKLFFFKYHQEHKLCDWPEGEHWPCLKAQDKWKLAN